MRALPPQLLPFWETNEEDGVPKLRTYDDGSGNPTIGWGHTGPEVKWGMTCTRAQADAWAIQDLTEAQTAVDHLVTVPLNDNQDSAIVDFVGNAGAGALAKSTLLRKLNAGDYAGASKEFARWAYAKN